MSGNDAAQSRRAIVARFFSLIMEPLSRITMRFGYSAREAADSLRWSYVRSFYDTHEFWIRGKPSFVQAAIKTGIPRAQVKALRGLPTANDAIFSHRQNLAYRVIEGWVNDPEFHVGGEARRLPLHNPVAPSFRKLAAKYGNDIPWTSVLSDLKIVGCVEVVDDQVVLLSQTYGLNLGEADRLELIGFMIRRLLETSDHNLCHGNPSDRRMQRVWRQILVPSESISEVRERVSEIAIKAGREADAVLSQFAHATPVAGISYAEVGLVSFIYEESNDKDRQEHS